MWCFVHNYIWPCDLDLRPFDLGGMWWIKSLTHTTHVPIFNILRLSDPELCVTQSDHITITWNGHCTRAVSRELSPAAKMIHIFEIPDRNLLIHFVSVRELRRRLSYAICEKYPLWRLQSSWLMRSIRWPVHGVSPKTIRNNFWPRIVYSLYNFYGATLRWWLRVVHTGASPR